MSDIFRKKVGWINESAGHVMEKISIKYLKFLLPFTAGLFCISCLPGMPNVEGVPSVSSSPGTSWFPRVIEGQRPPARQESVLPLEQVKNLFGKLSLASAVDIALQNNPATRAAWADARAAAAAYGSARGSWFPTISLSGSYIRSRGLPTPSSSGISPAEDIDAKTATASLSYLLFDFGGRSSAVELSKQALLAADWTHNAVIQETVLNVETAFFNYAGAVAMLEADKISLSEAEANLAAAKERRRLGVATKADELQAQTAYSEAELAVQAAEGQVRTARGALSVAMGFSADQTEGLMIETPEFPESGFSETIDRLIEKALANRADLQAVRVQVQAAEAKITQARSKMLPSITAQGSLSREWIDYLPGYNDIYSINLSLNIPLFNGLSHEYDLLKAKEDAEAARERARAYEQTVVFQVFSAHSAFLTADQRVKTTNDLLTSAQESEEVALGRYKEGVGSILDLLSAQRVLANARAVQINARLDWFVSLAQLAYYTGVLDVHGDNPLAINKFH